MRKTIVVFLYTTQKQTKPNRPIHNTQTSHMANRPKNQISQAANEPRAESSN